MKVPISWLKEYVDFEATPEDLAEKLTFSGIEVEGIRTIGAGLENIVVGEVREIRKHPGADKLTLCKVNNGREVLAVVCGASNYKVGDKVAFAGVGVNLPDGTQIKKAKLRGEVSFGMMCSESELGLSDAHSGIMTLAGDLVPGTSLEDVVGPPETVLDLEITWNRPDCLSIIGIAREVAALYGRKMKLPVFNLSESDVPVESLARVKVNDFKGCPRYTARVLSGLKTGPSPEWMRKRLSLCGIRPINNVVDITNYVLLECGHPLHAFDYKRLAGDGKVVDIAVRRAVAGETMATLDNVKREIAPDMLVIADALGPVAVAGVMGGAGSEILNTTESVLLESAYFEPADIRRTSAALGLTTESSYRFERGIDISTVEWASARAAALLAEFAGAKAAKGVIDVYPEHVHLVKIKCRFQRVRDLLGTDVSDDGMVSILKSLELVVNGQDTFCEVQVPSFRRDLVIEADIIEEIARMHGIDAVPSDVFSTMVVAGVDDKETRALELFRGNVSGLGLSEIMNYSFLSKSLLAKFYNDEERWVVLPNPVSDDHSVLRSSLLPQMGAALAVNLAHQTEQALLFEIGRVFSRNSSAAVDEETRLSIGMMGAVGRTGSVVAGGRLTAQEIFLWLKGIIESLFAVQKVHNYKFQMLDTLCFDKGTGVEIYVDGEVAGIMGVLSNEIRSDWRMLDPVAVAELAVKPLLKNVFNCPALRPVPVFPSISRDMALLIPQHVDHEMVVSVVRKNAPTELTEIRLFDIYSGQGVEHGMKSLAYSVTYRSLDRTLTDEDANGYHERIKEVLKTELGVKIR